LQDENFVADGWRLKLAATVLVVFSVTGVWNLIELGEHSGVGQLLRFGAGSSQLAVAALFVWVLAHRKRPIVELSGDVIRYRSIYWAKARTYSRIEDITDAVLKGRWLELMTTAAQPRRLWLGDLSRRSREAVCSAIASRLHARPAS